MNYTLNTTKKGSPAQCKKIYNLQFLFFLHLVCHIFSYISGNMRSILAWNSIFLILLFIITVYTFWNKKKYKVPTVALGYINKSTNQYEFCEFSSLTPKAFKEEQKKLFSEHLSFIRLSGVRWMICMFLSNTMLVVSLSSSSIRWKVKMNFFKCLNEDYNTWGQRTENSWIVLRDLSLWHTSQQITMETHASFTMLNQKRYIYITIS